MGLINRRMIVALGAAVVFAFVFLVLLRPGGATPASDAPLSQAALEAEAAATGQPIGAVAPAQGAVAGSEAGAAQKEAAANAVGADPATAAPAPSAAPAATAGAAPEPAPAVATKPGDPSGPLLQQLADGKVLVVLFKGDASDDRAVARAVRRAGGKGVATHIASIDEVGDYEAITAGVQVLTSPTVLVIGADKKAHAITGFTDSREIEQLVGDVRR